MIELANFFNCILAKLIKGVKIKLKHWYKYTTCQSHFETYKPSIHSIALYYIKINLLQYMDCKAI